MNEDEKKTYGRPQLPSRVCPHGKATVAVPETDVRWSRYVHDEAPECALCEERGWRSAAYESGPA